MPKIRVLVVDDAVVIRKILTDTISSDEQLEVIGTAPNGKIALQKIPQLNPDIITLDIEMPEMDGLETLRNIKKDYPKLPVIMFSTLTERGAAATFEALAIGASDYVTKPANVGNVTASKDSVKEDLIRKIKQITMKDKKFALDESPKAHSPLPKPVGNAAQHVSTKVTGRPHIDVLCIGVSTGGPNALAEVLPALPQDLGVPVVIVQHMPPMFTRLLAERLNTQSKLKVVEAGDGMPVQAGTVFIAPGDYHMETVRAGNSIITKLHQGPQENSCRPAVDVLFRSVVSTYGNRTLGVILTGMGQDGLRGCELIKEVGGSVITQDKDSSVVWGMPGYVTEAGLSDIVLPLKLIAQEITRRVKANSVERSASSSITQAAR